MLVHDLLAASVRERPDHPAVVDASTTLTYAQLGTAVDRAVGWLRANGVTRGDRVAYAGGNDHRFLAVCFATLRCGAIFVPLHPELTAPQIAQIAEDCTPALVIRGNVWGEIEGTAPDPSSADVTPDDTALLIYTSGTTGRPKGVVCPHRQMRAAAAAINDRLRYGADDVVLCRLPLSFDYGLYQALLCASTGATLVLSERIGDAALLHFLVKHGVTVVPLVPSLAQMLILLQRRHRLATDVRLFTNTGARLGRETAADLLELFPGAGYASMYGMTECKRIAILEIDEYAAHPDSVGRAIPGDTVRIVDPDGNDVAPGVVGEIVVHGTTVMAGYWNVPLDKQNRYIPRPDGSLELHTGDQGRLDADGRLYFVGRDDDMIKRRGIRVGLTEIENAAELVPGVVAAVAPRPAHESAPLRLAVRLSPALDGDRAHSTQLVRELLRERLDRARTPDRVLAIDEIPLTRNGKPDRAAVARLLDELEQHPTVTPLDNRTTAQTGTRHDSAAV